MQSKIISGLSAFFIMLGTGLPASAAAPELSLPIDCELGKTCWLVNLVDREPGPGRTDYRCGDLSYNTHKGTDIAIRDAEAMRAGVPVLAAAPGRVVATRDGMADSTREDLASVDKLRGKDCGNGLVIAHGDGWTTQYCHMKAGSLSVRKGDKVDSGTRLGEVGQSGRSEFPHIHMTLRKGKTVYDPFTADTAIASCNADAPRKGFWSGAVAAELSYPGPQPYHLGFSGTRPDIDRIRQGQENGDVLDSGSDALVFWAQVFTVAKSDTMTLSVLSPNGETFVRNTTVADRPLARWFGFAGKRRQSTPWPKGVYTGTITVARDGLTPIMAKRKITVE